MPHGFKDEKGRFRPTSKTERGRATQFFTQNPHLEGRNVSDIRNEPHNKKIIDLPMKERVEALKNNKTVLQTPDSKSAVKLAKKTNKIVFISKDGSFINPNVELR